MTLLRIGPTQTVLSRTVAGTAASSHAMAFGAASIAALLRHDPPAAYEIEQAIDAIEEEIMRVPAAWRPVNALATNDHATGLWSAVAAGPLTLETVEALFQRLASAALGDPLSARGLPAGSEAAAVLVILREVMHHLGAALVEVTS